MPKSSRPATLPVLLLALADVALHLATAARYGIFRDELYYIACARHLTWGYVDHPPLIALITWLVIHTLGTSLIALRLLPALAGGALVILTARTARELGGNSFAQTLAAAAILPVPIYLILHHWLTMNAFEPLLWTGVLYFALRLVNTRDPRYWLPIGILTGIGFENKYSMLFCITALILGLLLTPSRLLLRTRWFWISALIATAIFMPNLIWLIHHHFPFLEFEQNSRLSGSRIKRGPIAFLADQALIMNPLSAALALAGLCWLFISRPARAYRFLGFTCAAILLTLLLIKAKNYYAAPAYPALFAAGAAAFESFTANKQQLLRPVFGSALLLSGFFFAPLVMPILPIPPFLKLQAAMHGFTPVRFENQPGSLLPQYFSDEFGWEDMVRKTAAVYSSLPKEEQPTTAIFANDYGQAAAIDFFGPRYGLPPSVSKAESFWLWGPRSYTGQSVIVLGSDGAGDRRHFRSVQIETLVDNPYARADEHYNILLCHDLNRSLQTLWPSLKSW